MADVEKPTLNISDSSDSLNSYSQTTDSSKTSNQLAVSPAEAAPFGSDVKFQLPGFQKFIDTHGLKTQWQQAFICPCISEQTGSMSPDPLCPICHGVGIGYLPPIDNVRIAFTDQARGANLTQIGLFEAGTAYGTVQMGYDVSHRDRIVIPEVYTRQNFMFNLTDYRQEKGMYIPYDVKSFSYVAALKDGHMVELSINHDFTYNEKTHTVNVINTDYNGCGITLNLNVTLRYIVTSVLKEIRYQYGDSKDPKKTVDSLFRRVAVKREDVFQNNVPIAKAGEYGNDDKIMSKASENILDHSFAGLSNLGD